jgi:hypothetical protein
MDTGRVLTMHTIIELEHHYTEQTAKLLHRERTWRSRLLLHFVCIEQIGTCSGTILQLEPFETGAQVGMDDVADLWDNLKLTGHTGRTYTFALEDVAPPGRQPPVRTLTVNYETKTVEYMKKGEGDEAHGIGSCAASS